MRISGQLLSRLRSKYQNLVGKTGVVIAVSTVNIVPNCFEAPYQVCMLEFKDGSRGTYQVANGNVISMGDEVRIALRFGFADSRGLRFYIPKVINEKGSGN